MPGFFDVGVYSLLQVLVPGDEGVDLIQKLAGGEIVVFFPKHIDEVVEVGDEGFVLADGEGPDVGQLVPLVLFNFPGHTYL